MRTPMAAQKTQLNPVLKLVLDIGPLVLFFAANSKFGIFAATGAFMVAVLVALAVSYVMTRHIAVMPVVTAVIVLVFGGLTLLLHDGLFIKLKPTIIYVLFGGTLVGGLLFGKPLLGIVFDSVFHLSEEGWRKLTWRWALFFFALAILNEIVWLHPLAAPAGKTNACPAAQRWHKPREQTLESPLVAHAGTPKQIRGRVDVWPVHCGSANDNNSRRDTASKSR